MLAARAMGLDSCPLIGFDAGKAADIIRLPRDHVIAMMLVIGKGLREPWPKPGYIERHEFILEDRF
jgi:nitroreductase